jgi:hypothetical protein
VTRGEWYRARRLIRYDLRKARSAQEKRLVLRWAEIDFGWAMAYSLSTT